MHTHISVTKQWIDAGTPMDTCRCPVALAIASAFPGQVEEIEVVQSVDLVLYE